MRRRGRGVCWRIGTAGLLKMNLTSHLRVGADPSHFDVSLERLRRVHERLVLAQTLLKSGGHERIVLGEIDDLGDLLAVLVPSRSSRSRGFGSNRNNRRRRSRIISN